MFWYKWSKILRFTKEIHALDYFNEKTWDSSFLINSTFLFLWKVYMEILSFTIEINYANAIVIIIIIKQNVVSWSYVT